MGTHRELGLRWLHAKEQLANAIVEGSVVGFNGKAGVAAGKEFRCRVCEALEAAS